jgi:cellulose synthase/poly-beta-1,6-N-acetylglucosamine synthase-like glycosyltransferase
MQRVKVVIPCRNESAYIGRCIESLLQSDVSNTYLSIAVVDGMSDDGTRDIVARYAAEHATVQLVDNVQRTTPFALNLGLRTMDYDVGIILGAHAEVEPDFVAENLRVLREHPEVGCAGGVITNVHENELSQVISMAMASPFGVGNAYFRTGGKSGYVDTVAFGAYRREVFEQCGFFDEELIRNQDDEFNYRISQHGFKIYLEPSIRSNYFVRGSFTKLYKQYFQYGYWKVFVNKKHRAITSLRQLAPPLWMLFVILGWVGFFIHPYLGYAYIGLLTLYLGIAKWVAYRSSRFHFKLMLKLLWCYCILHASYGLGYLKGILHLYVLSRKPSNSSAALTR